MRGWSGWMALVLGGLLLAGCQTAQSPHAATARHPLILISIDGFRADYLDRGVTPNIRALADGGVRAERMLPSFPSVTFPNHYTLVTGLYPDHHGIVNNRFFDAAMPEAFRMSAKEPVWWNGAAPVWVSAEQQGMRTATLFWPGSEVEIQGVRPSRYLAFDQALGGNARVDRLLAWLDEPTLNPGFLTLYFDLVDTGGHLHGPDSAEVNKALAMTDAAIGRLVAGLKARGIDANLIVLADHGMAAIGPDDQVWLEDIADPATYDIVADGELVLIAPKPGAAGEAATTRLLAPHDHLTCWRKGEVPARLHYGTHPRIPAIVCTPQVGWLAATREREAKQKYRLRGGHGYDNADPRMGALFVARGPAFASGVVLKPFPNVDVYPLMMRVLDLKPQPNDGHIADFEAALRRAR